MNAITRDGSGILGVLLIFPILITLLIAAIAIRSARKKAILHEWAERQGLRLLNCETRWVRLNHFPLSKLTQVYYVTVQFADGLTSAGWLRCTGSLIRFASDVTVVRWDDKPPERYWPGFPVVPADGKPAAAESLREFRPFPTFDARYMKDTHDARK